jgi:hypothetical protein
MVRLHVGARFVSAYLNAINTHAKHADWKATRLTTLLPEVLGVEMMNSTFNAYALRVIVQKAA